MEKIDNVLYLISKYNSNIDKLLDILLKLNIADFKLREKDNFIKFRYECFYKNKNTNIFIYLKKWDHFIKLYNLIPDEKKHFYEIIDNKCKFFLDIDAKCDELDEREWNQKIICIKKELEKMFLKIFNKNINIIEYQSYPNNNEPKYSCHLVVSDYCFYADDCKVLCNIFLNMIDSVFKDIIDNTVYGRRRMLRIEKSSKLNSLRNKICINNINVKTINLDGFITYLEKTEFIEINYFLENIYINHNINNKTNHCNNIKLENKLLNKKKYNYTNEDVSLIKSNYEKIENIINIWHLNLNNESSNTIIFKTTKIIDNMILYKRLKKFKCVICQREHEKQNPYVFIKYKVLYFDCRRSNKKPIIVPNFVLF